VLEALREFKATQDLMEAILSTHNPDLERLHGLSHRLSFLHSLIQKLKQSVRWHLRVSERLVHSETVDPEKSETKLSDEEERLLALCSTEELEAVFSRGTPEFIKQIKENSSAPLPQNKNSFLHPFEPLDEED